MKEPVPAVVSKNGASKSKQLRFLIIGAGARGTAYAEAVTKSTGAVIHAVADPHKFKRDHFGKAFIWGKEGKPSEGQDFNGWKEWLDWELNRRRQLEADPQSVPGSAAVGVDGVFICTLDETHIGIIRAIAPLQLHILCEKPLALSLDDCLSALHVLQSQSTPKIFSIGHVLRYSPHNILLRDLILSRKVVGDVVSIEHCEPVGWWHFTHSYVRGNWRRATSNGDGSLLTKSCHDIDFILWLLCSPPPSTAASSAKTARTAHHPRTITSTGSLTQFRRARKPAAAGNAINCLSCPAEPDCIYSAVKIYRDMHLAENRLDWPLNILCPDIEDIFRNEGSDAATRRLMNALAPHYDKYIASSDPNTPSPWYGKCVFETDNDVCDDQVVTISWEDEELTQEQKDEGIEPRTAKIATFHMIAPTERQCERRGRIYGTHGELTYDSRNITIYNFETCSTTAVPVPRQPPEEEKSHGGGDYGLARSFVGAVDAVENRGWDIAKAQEHFVGCTLEEAVRSHAVVFAAEEARREEKVVKWKTWWEEKLQASAAAAAAAK